MPSGDADDILRLRAYIDAKRRDIEQNERSYDVNGAAKALIQLARPLTHPHEFSFTWKRLYLDQFYRDVAKFVLTFVSAHLLPGFSSDQRHASFEVFFDTVYIPPLRSLGVLMGQIAATHPSPSMASEETTHTLTECVALVQRVLETRGVGRIVEFLLQEDPEARVNRSLLIAQPPISSLCSIPDLVFNRLQRATPVFFAPRSFYAMLCEELLDALLTTETSTSVATCTAVFRLFTDKLVRMGHMQYLLRAWLARRDLYDPTVADAHRRLLGSLPQSAMEPFLQYLATLKSTKDGKVSVVSASQYLLLSLVPNKVWRNKQIQFVVAHKLLLTKSLHDLVFVRMLVDSLAGAGDDSGPKETTPLDAIFDVVVNRWSGDSFPVTTDVGLNTSIVFFLRYAMQWMNRDTFEDHEWTMKLCKGVQTHMAHSVDRVRLLGMRVGESVSKIISPDHLLNFEINDPDSLEEISRLQFDFSLPDEVTNEESQVDDQQGPKSTSGGTTRRSASKKQRGVAWMDPDQVVDSDDDNGANGEEDDDDDGSDAESDMSLDAYDLNDDEADLQPQRPVYIKDLLASLHAEDDREKMETALAEAEALIRRKPKDLQYNGQAIAQALLRLEDKYSTPNFALFRAKALAAICALSPSGAIPYLQKQALEREQLLQSRIDVLEAMSTAAQELSETGAFRPNQPKNLLSEDLETRTMQGLKTRRFGYRRDPLAPAKKNAFADHALSFFSPLLFGYVHYVKGLEGSKRLSEVEDVFLAHLLHALSSFVECAGHAPPAVPMAKGLMEFAWHYRSNTAAAVRRQVLYAFSRILLVMPPFLLRQELGQNVIEMMAWLDETRKRDPDEGCREASRLLLSSGAIPMLTMS